jgi:beta-glucosidase
MQVSHHLLLSHGLALQALRAQGCKSRLGIVLNLSPHLPAADTEADHAKTRLEDGRASRWYLDPLFRGAYPADVLAHLGADAPKVEAGDMAHIATTMDFLGVNYYTRAMVSAAEPWDARDSGFEVTEMGWEVYPDGLTDLLVHLNEEYPVPPMYLTENGAAYKDLMVDGRVHDERRRAYISSHIAAVGDALRRGVKLEGYMVWSLLDNFEWASGYEKRFGIVHVDYESQRRTLKDSALWYRDFLQRQKAAHRSGAALVTGV